MLTHVVTIADSIAYLWSDLFGIVGLISPPTSYRVRYLSAHCKKAMNSRAAPSPIRPDERAASRHLGVFE